MSSLKAAFAGIRQQEEETKAERPDAQTAKRRDVEAPKKPIATPTQRTAPLPLQGTAKSKHPDFVKKTLYVRKTTMRDALRRYEDAGGTEESELVEMLLSRYIGGGHG